MTAVPAPRHPWSVPAAWTAVVATLVGTAWGFLGGAPLHVRVFEAATDGGAAGAATVVLVSVAWTLVGPRGSGGR